VVSGVVFGVVVAVVVATIEGDGVVGCMVAVLACVVGDAGLVDEVGVPASVAGLDADVTVGEGSEEPVEERSAQPVAVSATSALRPTASRRAEVAGAGRGR
jgi:hypothetical protein